ncbi:MAG: hypothetical protein ACYS0K_24480 [Planctomycetota bacterium]
MIYGRAAGALVLLAVLFSAGCSTPKQVFMHKWHRGNYAISDEELKTVQFYISTEILAKSLAPGQEGTPEGIVIVPEETPGVATEVGPGWLRISFQEGGRGVPFVTVVSQSGDSAYWLGTEVEGQGGFRRLRDLPEKVLRVEGTAYQLVHGGNARLLIGAKDLEKLIEQRTHIQGRTKPAN